MFLYYFETVLRKFPFSCTILLKRPKVHLFSKMVFIWVHVCSIHYSSNPGSTNHVCRTYTRRKSAKEIWRWRLKSTFLCCSQLEDQIRNMLPRIPVPLQEAALRLASKESRQRPTAQLLSLIKYFR